MRDRVASHLHACINSLQLTNQMKGMCLPVTVFQHIFFSGIVISSRDNLLLMIKLSKQVKKAMKEPFCIGSFIQPIYREYIDDTL
jgi:hypothetical protein